MLLDPLAQLTLQKGWNKVYKICVSTSGEELKFELD